jgi:3,4-dihydroxy 2-butanone 4-phosphate synthase/GTP cyclohydrolase II
MSNPSHNTIQQAIEAFANGNPVIICDSADREDEGDLVIAAQHCTPQWVQFFTRNSSGILCVALTKDIAVNAGLKLMTSNNTDPNKTNFTISVDASNTTTGVSAIDKTNTIQQFLFNTPSLRSPGHIFPLVAKDNLLTERQGHTEASVALCKLANLTPVALIAECSNDDGSMMRYQDCRTFANKHNLHILTIQDLISYTASHPITITPSLSHIQTSTCALPISVGGEDMDVTCTIFKHALTDEEIVCISYGSNLSNVRVHSECFTGHILHSLRCDCEEQMMQFLQVMKTKGGSLYYVGSHEGRGIGLFKKIQAYHLQLTGGFDTYEANKQLSCPEDCRDYSFMKDVLTYQQQTNITLYTNNKTKVEALAPFVRHVVPMHVVANKHNIAYLAAKHAREESKEDQPLVAPQVHIAVISTTWNRQHMEEFWKVIHQHNKEHDMRYRFTEYVVPGAFEIPSMIQTIATGGSHGVDAILCLGVVKKGETMHFEYICEAVFPAIMQCTMQHSIPIINGVLAVLSEDQIPPRYPLAKSWIEAAETMIRLKSHKVYKGSDQPMVFRWL